MSLRRGDDDYYYYIICVIVLRAKAEHALDTRYSADEQRATTTTRVLDGCCVPAGVTLQSSSSYALARSLAHPDRAGEPRTRPPTEDTPHIDRNLARSEPRPPISLTITNRRQGHTSRRYPRAQQHGEAYSPNFREFPSVRWTTAVPIARSGHALLLLPLFANFTLFEVSLYLSSTVIVRIGASIGFSWGCYWRRSSNIDFNFDFEAKNYIYIYVFRCNHKVSSESRTSTE